MKMTRNHSIAALLEHREMMSSEAEALLSLVWKSEAEVTSDDEWGQLRADNDDDDVGGEQEMVECRILEVE